MSKKQELAQFIIDEKILSFGEFITNSGRKTPYFCNFGNLCNPLSLEILADFYADNIIENFGRDIDNVFGPAYKGISLAIATSTALSKKLGKKVSFSFNRKEAKDHGEKGLFIGHSYTGSEKVVIVEDVLTSGKSLKQAYELLAKTPCQVLGSLVCIDRQEKNLEQTESARASLERETKKPVFNLITASDVLNFASQGKELSLENKILEAIKLYQKNYLSAA